MRWLDRACEAKSYKDLYEMKKKWDRLDALLRARLLKAASRSDSRLYESIMDTRQEYRQDNRRLLRGQQVLNIIVH